MFSQYICGPFAFLLESMGWKDEGALFSRSIGFTREKELTCAVAKAGKPQLEEGATDWRPKKELTLPSRFESN